MEAAAGARLPEPKSGIGSVRRDREGGREREGFVALDRNERLAPLPEWFLDELRRSLTSELLTQYPALDALHEDVCAWLGLSHDRVLLVPGSDAAFRALYQAYVRPGDDVVMLDPSYAMYAVYARMFGARPLGVGFEADLSLDADALLARIAPGVKLVLLANPNQPTGTVLSEDALEAVLERAAEVGALVVVDEAYHPFSQTTVLPWIDQHPNLLVTRTFSKVWGLAGPRVGAQIGDGHGLPFAADCFDYVLCFERLEHVESPAQLLGELARVCRPDGRVFVSIPWVPRTFVHPRRESLPRGAAHVFEFGRRDFGAPLTHTPLEIRFERVCELVGRPSNAVQRGYLALTRRSHILAGMFRRFQFFELGVRS